MANEWLEYVKAYRENHPEISYKQALVLASQSYRRTNTVGAGQEGGLIGTLATIGSLGVASNALSQPIAKAVISENSKIKPKPGSKREYDTNLIADRGLIASIPEIIQGDKERRKAKREARLARQKL